MTKLIITDAGRAEVINSSGTGTGATQITELALGNGVWEPDHEATMLQDEFKRLPVTGGGVLGPGQIHLNTTDTSDDYYSATELGIFLASGTLFGVMSSPNPLIAKATLSQSAIAIDIELLGDIEPDMVSFGDTSFEWNSATTTTPGIVRLATRAETQGGTLATVAATPDGVRFAIRDGVPAFATKAQAEEGTATDRAMSPLRTKEAIEALTPEVSVPNFSTQAQAEEGTNSDTIMSPERVMQTIDKNAVRNTNPDTPLVVSKVGDTITIKPEASLSGFEFKGLAANANIMSQTGQHVLSWSDTQILDKATQPLAEAGADLNLRMTPFLTKQAIDAQRAYATQAQAQAGTLNTVVMSPLRTANAIDNRRPYSTKAQAEAATANTGVMTPLRVKEQLSKLMELKNVNSFLTYESGVTRSANAYGRVIAGTLELYLTLLIATPRTSGHEVYFGFEVQFHNSDVQCSLTSTSASTSRLRAVTYADKVSLRLAEGSGSTTVQVHLTGPASALSKAHFGW